MRLTYFRMRLTDFLTRPSCEFNARSLSHGRGTPVGGSVFEAHRNPRPQTPNPNTVSPLTLNSGLGACDRQSGERIHRGCKDQGPFRHVPPRQVPGRVPGPSKVPLASHGGFYSRDQLEYCASYPSHLPGVTSGCECAVAPEGVGGRCVLFSGVCACHTFTSVE